MKRAIWGALILAVSPCLGQAQSSDYSKWYGYGYFAPGGRVTTADGSRAAIHMGGGIERFFTRHLGAGMDLGYFRAVGDCCTEHWGTFSPSVVARYGAKDKKKGAEGFVTAGYTRISHVRLHRDDGNGMNFGFGFNWWFDKRAALRIEVRDHVHSLFSQGAAVHFLGLRIGLTFR